MAGARVFIAIAGLVFAAIFLAHVARLFAEGAGPISDPMFIATSLISLAAAMWSAILLLKARRAA